MKIKPADYNNMMQKYHTQRTQTEKAQTTGRIEGDVVKETKATNRYQDRIEISEEAAIYQKSMEEMGVKEPSDMNRVNAIRAQVENGSYELNPGAIAASIVDHIL